MGTKTESEALIKGEDLFGSLKLPTTTLFDGFGLLTASLNNTVFYALSKEVSNDSIHIEGAVTRDSLLAVIGPQLMDDKICYGISGFCVLNGNYYGLTAGAPLRFVELNFIKMNDESNGNLRITVNGENYYGLPFVSTIISGTFKKEQIDDKRSTLELLSLSNDDPKNITYPGFVTYRGGILVPITKIFSVDDEFVHKNFLIVSTTAVEYIGSIDETHSGSPALNISKTNERGYYPTMFKAPQIYKIKTCEKDLINQGAEFSTKIIGSQKLTSNKRADKGLRERYVLTVAHFSETLSMTQLLLEQSVNNKATSSLTNYMKSFVGTLIEERVQINLSELGRQIGHNLKCVLEAGYTFYAGAPSGLGLNSEGKIQDTTVFIKTDALKPESRYQSLPIIKSWLGALINSYVNLGYPLATFPQSECFQQYCSAFFKNERIIKSLINSFDDPSALVNKSPDLVKQYFTAITAFAWNYENLIEGGDWLARGSVFKALLSDPAYCKAHEIPETVTDVRFVSPDPKYSNFPTQVVLISKSNSGLGTDQTTTKDTESLGFIWSDQHYTWSALRVYQKVMPGSPKNTCKLKLIEPMKKEITEGLILISKISFAEVEYQLKAMLEFEQEC